MPVSDKTSDEEVPRWGSIKQKILQWESIENISQLGTKTQPVKQRPKLSVQTFQPPEPESTQPEKKPTITETNPIETETNQENEPQKIRRTKVRRQNSTAESNEIESTSQRQDSRERLSQSKQRLLRHTTSESKQDSDNGKYSETGEEVSKIKVKRQKSKDGHHRQAVGDSPRKTRIKRQQSIDLVEEVHELQQSELTEQQWESNGSEFNDLEPEVHVMMRTLQTFYKDEIPINQVKNLSNDPSTVNNITKTYTNEVNCVTLEDDFDIEAETSEDWYIVEASDTRDEEEEITTDDWPVKSRKVESLEDDEVEVEICVKPDIAEVFTTQAEVVITRAVKNEEVEENGRSKDKEIDGEVSPYLNPNDEYDSDNSAASTFVPEVIVNQDYRKILGHATMKAEPNEVKLAALLYLRGINSKKEFFLASSVDGAGAFDNIVFKYKSKDIDDNTTWKTSFIQVRNKENDPITPESLILPEGNFSLMKDFKSYCEIKEKMSKNSAEQLFKDSFQDCSFVLYTNAKVSEKLTSRLREKSSNDLDKLLKSGLNNELMFTLNEESDKDIFTALGPEKRDFLKKVRIFSGQPLEIDLDHLIKMELRAACSNYLSNVHIIYRFFIEAVQQWWTDDTNFLTQKINLLDKAENIFNVYTLTINQKQMYRLPDVYFKDIHLEQWRSEIRKKNPLMCIVTTNMTTKFSATKLMQILWEENIEYIFTSLKSLLNQREEVIAEWMSGEKDMLVIVSEVSDEHEELCDELCRIFKKKPHKQLVVLSPPCDPFTTNLQLKYSSTFEELYDPFDLLQLDKESTDQILEKEVKFQGCPIYLRCISGDDIEKISHVLTSDNFDIIVDSATINIGDTIDGHFENYKPRTFQRCDVIKESILTSEEFWGVLAFTNVTVDELQELVPPGNKVLLANEPNSYESRYLVLDSSHPEGDYNKLCETRKDVHWLHMVDTSLLWRRSQRNITSLAEYIEDQSTSYQPEHVLDLDDRVILVVADAKMGKSTLTTHLAKETKLADPSMWVIKVDLEKHAGLLDVMASEEFNAVDFLASVGLDNSSSEFLARDLLRHSVDELGNVAVFLDGFDNIVPQCLRKALALLTSLLKTKIKKIFITSQYAMKEMLESNLSTLAYKMCPLEYNKDETSELFV